MAKATKGRAQVGYNELKAEVRAGHWRELYVLFGEETFLIDKLVEALGERLVAPGSQALDRVILHGSGRSGRLDLEKVRAEVMTPPFLSPCKLVIVRQSGWFSTAGNSRTRGSGQDSDDDDEGSSGSGEAADPAGKDRQAALTALFDQLTDSVCLVFVEQKVDRRLKKLVQAIERKGILAEFAREQPRTLQRWIDAECRRRGLSVEPAAAESLIDRCDGSMQVIWQELVKLFLYCSATGVAQVTRTLIDELSLPDLHGTIFDMTDALSEGKSGRALELADILISQKQPVQLIQFMLARHLRQLICAAELEQPGPIASELNVQPFVASRLARQARRLSPELLEQLYAACFSMDVTVKSGQITDRLGLETLLVESAVLLAQANRR